MASSSVKQMHIFFLVVIILSSSLHITHARDFQSFNKIPTTANKNAAVPEKEQADDQPSFLPQNEESYGLYGHEAGQLPPSATTTTKPKYLPKNYNTVSYVTVPENTNEEFKTTSGDDDGFAEERSFSSKNPNAKTYNYGEESNNYYNNERQQQKDEDFSEYRNSNYYSRLGSDFDSPRENRFASNNGGGGEGLKPQGMSDTRFLENGMYHYNMKTGKFSSNHPYETLKGSVFSYNAANGLGRTNDDVFNEEGSYVEDARFQDEDSNLP